MTFTYKFTYKKFDISKIKLCTDEKVFNMLPHEKDYCN